MKKLNETVELLEVDNENEDLSLNQINQNNSNVLEGFLEDKVTSITLENDNNVLEHHGIDCSPQNGRKKSLSDNTVKISEKTDNGALEDSRIHYKSSKESSEIKTDQLSEANISNKTFDVEIIDEEKNEDLSLNILNQNNSDASRCSPVDKESPVTLENDSDVSEHSSMEFYEHS